MSFLHTLFADAPRIATELARDEASVQEELHRLLSSFVEKQRILSRLLEGESVYLHLHRLEEVLSLELSLVEQERAQEREILDDLKFLSREAYVRRLETLRARLGTAISHDAYLAMILGELREVLAAQARKVKRISDADHDPGTAQALIDLLMIERELVDRLADVEDLHEAYRNLATGVRRERAVARIRDRFADKLLTRMRSVEIGPDGTARGTDGSYLSDLCARVFNHLQDGIAQAIETGAIAGHDQADVEYVASDWFDRFVHEQVRDDEAAGKAVPSERTLLAFIQLYRQIYLAQARAVDRMKRNPIGVHLALGAGDDVALAHAQWLGCTAAQVFTHSPQSFQFKPLDQARLTLLREGWKRIGVGTVVSHASYLINIASMENVKFHGAVAILRKELEYAAAYGCQYVVLHIGKHTTSTKEEGIAQVAKGIEKVADILRKGDVMLLLEGAAGQGTEIGAAFAEIGAVITALPKGVAEHVGVCLDTCHLYAAGHDIAQHPERVIKEIDAAFGIGRVKVIHVNDSKGGLGDRKDRHENLGKGQLGIDGLRAFLTRPEIRGLPMILETPFEDQKEQKGDMDALRGILGR